MSGDMIDHWDVDADWEAEERAGARVVTCVLCSAAGGVVGFGVGMLIWWMTL